MLNENNRQRCRLVGTIVLTLPTDNFSVLYRTRGLTIATLYWLAHGFTQWWIPRNQYDRVEIVPNIRDYPRIRNPTHQIDLEQHLRTERAVAGALLSYRNVTELDCRDNYKDDVTGNWNSMDMDLFDIFPRVLIITDTLFTTPLSEIYWLVFYQRNFSQSISNYLVKSCFAFDSVDNVWEIDLEQMFVFWLTPVTFGCRWKFERTPTRLFFPSSKLQDRSELVAFDYEQWWIDYIS